MSFTQSHTATWGLASCPRILQHMDWSMDRSTNIYSLTATHVLLLILYNWCHTYMYVYVRTRISKNLKISVFNVTGKNWVHIIVICRYSVDKYNKATKTNDKNTALWENKRRRCYAGSWCVCVCVCLHVSLLLEHNWHQPINTVKNKWWQLRIFRTDIQWKNH